MSLLKAKIGNKLFSLRLARSSKGRPYKGKGRRVNDPKSKTGYRYIYDEGPMKRPERLQPEPKKREPKSIRLKEGTVQHSFLLPFEEDYEKIQKGDEIALAEYTQRIFFQPVDKDDPYSEDYGMEVTRFARTLPRSSTIGFGLEEIAQETFVDLMRAQRKGRFESVHWRGFPKFVMETFKNAGAYQARKRKIKKETFDEISDMADNIDLATASVDQELNSKDMKSLVQGIADKVMDDDELSPTQKAVFKDWMAGKKHEQIAKDNKISVSASKKIMSREIGDKIDRLMTENNSDLTWKHIKGVMKKYVSFEETMAGKKKKTAGETRAIKREKQIEVKKKFAKKKIAVKKKKGGITTARKEKIKKELASAGSVVVRRFMNFGNAPKFMPLAPRKSLANIDKKVSSIQDKIDAVKGKVMPRWIKKDKDVKAWRRDRNKKVRALNSQLAEQKDKGRELKKKYAMYKATLVHSAGKLLLFKGKKAEIGEIRTRSDGQKYKKIGPNKWQPVESRDVKGEEKAEKKFGPRPEEGAVKEKSEKEIAQAEKISQRLESQKQKVEGLELEVKIEEKSGGDKELIGKMKESLKKEKKKQEVLESMNIEAGGGEKVEDKMEAGSEDAKKALKKKGRTAMKDAMKTAIKGIVETLSDVWAGGGGVGAATSAAREEAGALKQVGQTSKQKSELQAKEKEKAVKAS